jgi:cytidine deaminase
MNKIEKIIYYENFRIEELSEIDKRCVEQSLKARESAYAPYSNFSVGTSLLLSNGEFVLGNNQENRAYPSGLCAERVALFHFGANYSHQTIKTITITANNKDRNYKEMIKPCGACLQVIAEFELKQKEKIRIILYSDTGKVLIAEGVENFLPMLFLF